MTALKYPTKVPSAESTADKLFRIQYKMTPMHAMTAPLNHGFFDRFFKTSLLFLFRSRLRDPLQRRMAKFRAEPQWSPLRHLIYADTFPQNLFAHYTTRRSICANNLYHLYYTNNICLNYRILYRNFTIMPRVQLSFRPNVPFFGPDVYPFVIFF